MKHMHIIKYTFQGEDKKETRHMVRLCRHWLPEMRSELLALETSVDRNAVFVYQTAICEVLFFEIV